MVYIGRPLINPATTSTHTTRSPAELALLQEKLDAWVRDSQSGAGEHREVAADRIKYAYEQPISYLNLSYLGLTSLPEGVFSSLSNLEELDLTGNQISILSDKAFEGLSGLTDLNLSNNQIITLPDKAFGGLSGLRNLNLAINQISILSDKAFEGLSGLTDLNLSDNQIITLPDKVFEGLSGLRELRLVGNQFIFEPTIKTAPGCAFIFESDMPTVAKEFQHGNTHLLDFLLTGEAIPGASSARGRLKLDMMLKYANDHIIGNDESTWQHSATLNQLFYQASVLPNNGDSQDEAIKAQAQDLLTRYLSNKNVEPFAAQAEDAGIIPSAYEGLVFITQDGTQGLTIHKTCYEANILGAPFANREAANASLTNGVLIHNKDAEEANLFRHPDQVKPFTLINQAYLNVLNKEGMATLFSSMNMGEDYQKRFSEVLAVKSVGALASLRGTTQVEKNDVTPYKMVSATASTRLFDIFSALVSQSTDPTVDRLANRATIINEEHFKNICAAFPGVTEQEHPALLFALATLFVRYSASPVFGTENDSPAALRFYASALLNKLSQLDEKLFNQINGEGIRDKLFEDSCTDILSGDMRSIATSNLTLRSVYDQVTPEMWK